MIRRVLALVRARREEVQVVTSDYGTGYVQALEDVEEDILDVMHEEGIDDDG